MNKDRSRKKKEGAFFAESVWLRTMEYCIVTE